MQEVIIEVTGGVPTITVNGVKGIACKNLTRALENDLGSVTKSTPTKELYEKATNTAQAKR